MSLLHLESLSRQITKSDLLALLTSVGGLEPHRVGRIDLRAGEAVIEVPDAWQARLVKALHGQMLRDRRLRAWAESPPDSDNMGGHFERLVRLLELESRAEDQEAIERGRRLSSADAERTGTSLVDLVITDEETGLGGRHLLQLAKRNRSPLPWTRLGVGSPVVLSPDAGKDTTGHRGVVYERAQGAIRVALRSMSDDLAEQERWRLDLSSDEVAVQRQRAALQRAKSARAQRLAELRDVLLGRRPPEFDREQEEPVLDSQLNDVQREAVRFALAARDVALIHGPPGTGKTTAVVELIRRAVRRGEKVLACAPSNLAVDNVFERLLAAGERAVRLGHPARVMADQGQAIARQLTVQYRMHQAIMDFPSREFYGATLQADPVVHKHLLADLPGIAATAATQSPIEFIDTAGASFDEEAEPDGESRLNRQEAALVCRKVHGLLDSGVAAGDIAVIAPYAAQVRLLREQLPVPGLEIDSVDGFQGREKEAVVISLVRSNPQGEIGFLQDVRRMNVAMTRARRKLLIIGDSATLSAHPFYRRMIEYLDALGAYRTVWEEDGEI